MVSGISNAPYRFHHQQKIAACILKGMQAAIVVSGDWQAANLSVYFSGVMRSVNCCGVFGTQYDLRVSTPPQEALPTPR